MFISEDVSVSNVISLPLYLSAIIFHHFLDVATPLIKPYTILYSNKMEIKFYLNMERKLYI